MSLRIFQSIETKELPDPSINSCEACAFFNECTHEVNMPNIPECLIVDIDNGIIKDVIWREVK